MTDRRKGLLRGVGVLAAVLLAAGAISPAFSAFTPTKAKIKKIATKVVKNKIDDFGNPLFIQETELDRFGPVTANVGDPEKTVTTFGPFTISLLCVDNGGNVRIRTQIATSAANSTLNSDSDDEAVFDPADVDEDINDSTNGLPTDPQDAQDEDAEFFVAGPGGTPAYHGWVAPVTNFGGGNCWVRGWVLAL